MAADGHCHNVRPPHRSRGTLTRPGDPGVMADAVHDQLPARAYPLLPGMARPIQEGGPTLERYMAALHDGPAQLLTLALIQLDTAAAGSGPSPLLANSRGLVDQALAEIRGLIEAMRQAPDARVDLAASLGETSRQLQRLTGRYIRMECSPSLPPAPEPVARALLDAARELLMNACKYAGNAQIFVELSALAGGLQLTVQDDGPGYDPAVLARNDGHVGGYGLTCLRDRLGRVGARIELCSGPGHGVWAQIVWPGARAGDAGGGAAA